VKNLFSQIRLWVDHKHWIPIQTRLIEASEDHLTILLSNIKINPRLNEQTFKLKVPSDYERVEQKLPPSP
jgi:outer membrane lipoprotein-sorting protein